MVPGNLPASGLCHAIFGPSFAFRNRAPMTIGRRPKVKTKVAATGAATWVFSIRKT
jgi:hypothetical protein